MRIIVIQEGKAYPADRLSDLTGVKVGGSPLVESARSLRANGGQEMYVVWFVGVVSVSDTVYLFMPKFISSISVEYALKVLPRILGSIERYNRNNVEESFDYRPGVRGAVDDGFAIARFLIDEYVKYGLYFVDSSVRVSSGFGAIDWARSIETKLPTLIDGAPAYLDLVYNRRIDDRDSFIGRLHAAILSEISNWVESSLGADILGLPRLPRSRSCVNELGEIEDLLRIVEAERAQQFVSWKRDVLDAIADFLSVTSRPGSQSPVWVGTRYFNLVWEDACRDLFNLLDVEVHRPIWNVFPGLAIANSEPIPDMIEVSSGALIPDIVVQSGTGAFILDAKYYSPKFERDGLSGVPGVADVVKQLFYELVLRRELVSLGFGFIGNGFLFPAAFGNESFAFIRGEVDFPGRIDIFGASGMDSVGPNYGGAVRVIELNGLEVLRRYHENDRVAVPDVTDLFSAPPGSFVK